MKPFYKTLFIAASVCLIAINSNAFAQGRFSKGGRSRVSASRGLSSSMRSSRSSSVNRGSINRSSLNRGRTSVAGSSSRSLPSRLRNSQNLIRKPVGGNSGRADNVVKTPRNNAKVLPGKQGNSRTRNMVEQWKTGQGKTGITGRPRIPGKSGGRVSDLLKKPQAAGKTPQINGKPFRTLPFKPGSLNNWGAGKQPGSTTQTSNGWRNVVRNLMKHNRNHWCHTRPATCHWWTQYCQPIAHCHHRDVIVCDWSRVYCSPIASTGVVVQDIQWYLGMKGMLLPGKGIGIEAVEPGSPAELVGLQPGMVMTVCNGIPLVDEAAMQEAIRISGGVLQMTLLSADGSQVLEGTAQMTRVAAVSF